MKIIAVRYIYDPEQSQALAAHRPAHREFLRHLYETGSLLASGPLDQHEALIVVRAENPDLAITLLEKDPLHVQGIILEREAKVWNPVIGPWTN